MFSPRAATSLRVICIDVMKLRSPIDTLRMPVLWLRQGHGVMEIPARAVRVRIETGS